MKITTCYGIGEDYCSKGNLKKHSLSFVLVSDAGQRSRSFKPQLAALPQEKNKSLAMKDLVKHQQPGLKVSLQVLFICSCYPESISF